MSYLDGDIWLRSPDLAEWIWEVLEKRGFTSGRDIASLQRRIWDWTHRAEFVRVDSVDPWLCFLQMHPVDIPDELWVRKPGLPMTLDGRVRLRST